MFRYLVWLESGRTISTWATSETEVWFRHDKARHVKRVESKTGAELRASVELARELATPQTMPA